MRARTKGRPTGTGNTGGHVGSAGVLDLGDPGAARAGHEGTLEFIGTATVLIRFGGFTFLTDPNFLHQGDHAHLGGGLRSRRLTDPSMELGDLPPLDFVLLSHHHGDHFDQVVVEHLRKDVPIITTHHAAKKLSRQGFLRPLPLQTWGHIDVRRGTDLVRITATPAKHAPGPLHKLLPPVMGSMLDFGSPDAPRLRLYVTGDTLFFDGLVEIASRFPDVDVCVIHLGGTRIAGVLLTMDAAQGVRALQVLQPVTALPVHYDDYTVFRSPLEDFLRAAAAANIPSEIHALRRGETFRLGPHRTGSSATE